MQDLQSTLSAGTLIRERYLVKRLLGQSSSGAVYQVVDQRAIKPDGHMFALKELIGLSEQDQYQLLFDSILLRNIHHEALPRIHHVFNDDKRSRVCIVMEYVEGPDLEKVRQQQPEQRLAWPEVAQTLAPIVSAISYLHRQEPPIVHGDIKPANILFAQYEERFMLVGIEIIRVPHPDASMLLAMSGYKATTPSDKAADVRTDIYGFGATCYTMLTGTIPPNISMRAAHFVQTQADLLRPANSVVAEVPLHIAQAIHRAMSLNAEESFSSIEEFWQALQTPQKQLTPTVSKNFLSTIPSIHAVTRQVPGLADVQEHDLAKRAINNRISVNFHKGRAVPLLLLVLFLVLSTGMGTWLFAQSQYAASIVEKQARTTRPSLTTLAGSGTAPIVTPTSSAGNYPAVSGSYTGTVADIPANASATMILQDVHQVGGMINGYLTLGAPLEISGPFRGTIDLSKHFQFIVTDASGQPVLFLEGAIQSTTSISGDFYQCTSPSAQRGICSRASDSYGIWSALLVTAEG